MSENNRRLAEALEQARDALEALFEQCAMIHKHWGEDCNAEEADAAKKAGRAAVAEANKVLLAHKVPA